MYLVDNYWTGDGETSDSASIDVNTNAGKSMANSLSKELHFLHKNYILKLL